MHVSTHPVRKEAAQHCDVVNARIQLDVYSWIVNSRAKVRKDPIPGQGVLEESKEGRFEVHPP